MPISKTSAESLIYVGNHLFIFSRKARRRRRTSSASGVVCRTPRPSPPTRFPVPGIRAGFGEVIARVGEGTGAGTEGPADAVLDA